MSEAGEVKLAFAVRGGLLPLIHISNFAHLRAREKGRPVDLTCWECNGAVIPVLPTEGIADHYRHKSETLCSVAAGGESTLHFNAKALLAQEMGKFHQASLVYQCSGCRNWYSFLRIGPYDRVEPERKISTRKPDVSCWLGSSTAGAAEIRHRHAVNAEKQADLNALGMPWFEIPAINVHRQFFKFVEAADVLSIDARGAGITYPEVPSICEPCHRERVKDQEELQRREQKLRERAAANEKAWQERAAWSEDLWRQLRERQISERSVAEQERQLEQQFQSRKREEKAKRQTRWMQYVSTLSRSSVEYKLAEACHAEGVIPDIDEHGIRITIGANMSDMLWIAIAAHRTRNRKGRK